MAKKPEIQADALLNLVLDEATLKQQLAKALGTTIKEAAGNANLGDALVSPQAMSKIRRELAKTFKEAGKELGQALSVAQSDGLGDLLDKTRRDTIKKFDRDIQDLLSGKGRSATRSLPALPQLGEKMQDELRTALRVFGKESVRSGSYKQREPHISQANRNVAELNKVLQELAGLPSVAARDLQKIRSLVNDKDTGRYLRLQKDERASLVKSGQALGLQIQNLNRLAGTLSKMGFGDAAAEIKAANQARKALVTEFNRLSSPAQVEARGRIEEKAAARQQKQLEQAQRKALKAEARRREAEQKAEPYRTIFGMRGGAGLRPGIAATMDASARVRGGYGDRATLRAGSMRSLRLSPEERRYQAWFANAETRSRTTLDPLEQVRQGIARGRAIAASRSPRETAEDRRYQAWFANAETRSRTTLDPLEQVRQGIARGRAIAASRTPRETAEDRRYQAWFANAETRSRTTLDPLEQVRQGIARGAAINAAKARAAEEKALTERNEGIRKNGEQMLLMQQKFLKSQSELQQASLDDQKKAYEAQQKARATFARQTASYADAQRIIGGVGGIGNLSNAMDIGIVRGGLGSAYRQGQQRLNLAAAYGTDSAQYREALANLNQIRAQRDQLADRIRAVRSGGAGGAGGSGGGGRSGGDYSAAGNLLSTFSRYAIGYGGLYQVLNLVTQLKTEIIELDRAFYSIKAVTQATDIEMKAISRSIREVALNTNFSTREIAAAAEVLGQAGVAPAEMDGVLASTARFASATNSSLQVAADLLTTVRTVFKELEDATIADQLTKAINLSKLTAEDLKTILSLTSQTAASYNIDLEQMLAAVTTLRNAGVKPSTVATGLRQAMLEVFNPDTATLKALGKRYQEMGENLGAEQIRQRFFGFTNAQNPLLAALGELQRLGFNDEGQKTLQRGVDIRAFNAIQGLLSNFQELEEAESKITFGQAAAEGAEIQMQSLAASLENLGASVVVLAEQLSNGLVRELASGAKEATNLIEKLGDLDLQLKAAGEGGLGQVLGGALAGGVAGAVSGKGFRGKAVGALIGGTAGGYLSGGYKFDDSGEFGVGDAAGIAATLLLIGRAMKWVASISKAAAPVVQAAEAIGGSGAAAGGAVAARSIGSKFIPFIGWALTAISIIEAVADILPEDQVAKMKSQAEAASGQAAKLRDRLARNTELVNAFDPNATNPEPGTASAGFAKYQSTLENYRLGLVDVFGELTEAQADQVSDLLAQYASQTFTKRTNSDIRSRLEGVIGGTLGEGATDQVLFNLGKQREQVDATVEAYVDNTRQMITSVTERIRAARETGDEISAKDAAMSQAFSENAEELQSILDGTSGLDPEQVQERLKEFYARFVELVDERPALEAEERVKSMQALTAQLTAALSSSNNSAEIAQAVSQIGNSLEFVSLSAADRLRAINDAINSDIARIDAKIAEVQAKAPGKIGQFLIDTGLFFDRRSEAEKTADQSQLEALQANRSMLLDRRTAAGSEFQKRLDQQAEANAATLAASGDNAASLLSGFNNDPRLNTALYNDQMLRDVGLTQQQLKLVRDSRDKISAGDAGLFGDLAATRTDSEGNVVPSQSYTDLEKVFNLLAANLDRVTEAQLRRERDEKNLVGIDLLSSKTAAETAIKKADYGDNFALLASDSPSNPVVQLFDAQRQILEKELAQAKAKAEDAAEDGSKTAVGKQQAVLEAQAKLDTLDMEKEQELAKYQAKLRTAGEKAQRAADQEAKKQAKVAVTQTGIEQRKVKQDFDEAIRTGDIAGFQELSAKYTAVQEKLRTQLEEELKARGYTTSQILDEIKLREELNKPLAEQVENIRKLADQRRQQRDLDFRDIGSGPNLGSKFNTAYLGADGFTTEEQIAAGIRDMAMLQQRRAAVAADAGNALFKGDAETVQKLNQELDDLDTQLGETQAALDKMTRHPADTIYAAFSPRNLIIELENSTRTFEHLGDNLRGSLVSALDEVGDGLARAINEGEDFGEVLQNIINQTATSMLGDIFSTNLREGAIGLIKGATGQDGGGGGFGGVLGSLWGGINNMFGFGGAGKTAAGTEGGEQGGGGFLSGILGMLGGGGGAGNSVAGGSTSVGTMMVQAGSVTVTGGIPGSSMPGVGGIPGATNGAPAGVLGGATTQQGRWGGGWGGALGGAGIGAALGGAVGGKKGAGWGALLGTLVGAYFGMPQLGAMAGSGFGMAGGGHITKSGLVRGSGPRGVDSVPVKVRGSGRLGMLAPGEGVLNTKAMDALGSNWLNAANSGKLFTRAVGGVVDESYNATQRAQASAANSVAKSSGQGNGPVTVNLKNVNITDKSQVYAAMQTREGEDLMINRLKARGALGNSN